jgi:aquaporin NIP
MKLTQNAKDFIFESIVTFQLIFIGTGSIVYSQQHPERLGDFGIGLCFGFSVFIGILFFGRFANAHMNPAATLFEFLQGKLTGTKLFVLVRAQILGAMLASFAMQQLSPENSNLGATFPNAGISNSWWIEFGMTTLLLFAIFIMEKQKVVVVAITLGVVIFLEAWLGGPFTGASMNPIRSLAPALISGNFTDVWIYITAPFSAVLFVYLLLKVSKPKA